MGVLAIFLQGNVDLSFVADEAPFTVQIQAEELQGSPSILTYVIVAILLLLVISAFYRLGRLMGFFLKRQYFAKQAVSHMRFIATVFVLHGVTDFVTDRWELLRSDGFEWGITGDDLFGLMLSLTFLIVAHILNEARKNMDELEDYF